MMINYSKEYLEKEYFLHQEIARIKLIKPRDLSHSEKLKAAIKELETRYKGLREGYKLAANERDTQHTLKQPVKQSLNSSNASLFDEEEGCQGEEGAIRKMPEV